MGNYVSLAELKTALGITGSTEDDYLNLAIGAAEESINDLCGRVFTQEGSATARTYRGQPYYATIDDIYTMDGFVIKTHTSCDVTNDTTWASTDNQMEPLNNLQKGFPLREVRAVGDETFPVYGDGLASIQVTAKWGWASVPNPVKQAALVLSNRLYNRAKSSPMGVIGVGDFGPVRISRSDPDVASMLMRYKLPAVA